MPNIVLGILKKAFQHVKLIAQLEDVDGDPKTYMQTVPSKQGTVKSESLNTLQVASEADSRVWTEYIGDQMSRQLTTLTTSLQPQTYDPADRTHGMPTYLYVTLNGEYVAKITNESLSRHINSNLIFRRTCSPAFFFKDATDVERIGVITVTMQNEVTGTYTGSCTVSRWSEVYTEGTAVELTEDETVTLSATGILKGLISLNQSTGDKGAFAASNNGYTLKGLRAKTFAPTVRWVVEIPSENPAYGDENASGSGSDSYDVIYYRTYKSNYDLGCTLAGSGARKDETQTISENFSTTKTQSTDEERPGTLEGFGWDIVDDTINCIVSRPSYLDYDNTYTRSYLLEQIDSDPPAEDALEKYDVTETKRQELTISNVTDKHQKVEFGGVSELAYRVNPTLTQVIGGSYSFTHVHQTHEVSSYGTPTTDETTDSYNLTNVTLSVNDTVDASTGLIQVDTVTDIIVDTARNILTQNWFIDAKNDTSTVLNSNAVGSTYSPATLGFDSGSQTNYNKVDETDLVEPTRPHWSLCSSWDAWNPPSTTIRYQWGDTGNSSQIGGGFDEPYEATWDLE